MEGWALGRPTRWSRLRNGNTSGNGGQEEYARILYEVDKDNS